MSVKNFCNLHLFFSCDIFVENNRIPKPNKNWIGYSSSYSPELYRTINIKKKKLANIFEKKSKKGKFNYIGLAGIHDFKHFWKVIRRDKKTIREGEVVGINEMINHKVYTFKFNWHDCSFESLNKLRNKKKSNLDENILPKDNEFISFVAGKVIKFHVDRNFIKRRVLRQKILKKFTPNILDYSNNFYTYKKIQGKIFSKKNNIRNFQKLINFLQNFWKKKKLNFEERKSFCDTCFKIL